MSDGKGPSKSTNDSSTSAKANENDNQSNNIKPEIGDFVQLPQMFEVTPLTWCAHLEDITIVPEAGVDFETKCRDCNSSQENWICLSCYQVFCSRFINGHMLQHHQQNTSHNMVLSFSDLTVWCYSCERYVHNQMLLPVKRAVHISKFGTDIQHI